MSTGALPPNSSVSASPPQENPPATTTPPPPMASPPLVSPPSPANSSLSPPPLPPANSSLSPPPPPPSTPPPTTSPPPPQSDPPPPPPSSPPPKSQPQPPPSPPPSSPPPTSPAPPPPPATSRPPENSPAPPQPPPPNDPPPPSQPPPTPPSNTQPPPSPPQLSPPANFPATPPQGSSPPPIINTSPPPPPSALSPPSHTNATTTPSLTLSPPNFSPENSQPGGNGSGTTIGIVVAVVIFFLGFLGILACCLYKRKKKSPAGRSASLILPAAVASPSDIESESRKARTPSSYNSSNGNNNIASTPRTPGGAGGLMNSRSWFTYDELLIATNGFSDTNLLGEGGFGSVYKGVLSDGKEVAVKQLKVGGSQGEREFRAEVEIISRIHHRHLVSLVGYCIYDEGRILVYEYVPNNNLYFHLHGEGRPVLNWATRVKIAIGSARGLAYLHEDCHPRVIHRDIKTSNILLDNNFEARVSDFGLAKLAMDANTHVTTRVVGTFGYMAPEYASSGKLTEKSDVFSFGVVLLELITGRKPLDTSEPLGDESLVEWARPILSEALETHEFVKLADQRLNGNYDEGEMFRMIEAAAACVRHSSSRRPTMGQVVRAFDTMSTSDLTNGMRLGESDVYDHAPSTHVRVFQKMVNRNNSDFSMDSFFRDSYIGEERTVNS